MKGDAMELTAKELHDLYAPIWAKVPETRPRRHNSKAEAGLIFDRDRLGWETYNGRGGYYVHDGDEVPDFIAAALCRVAAEDFLLHKNAGAKCDRDVSLTKARVAGDYGVDCSDIPFTFAPHIKHPTIHHALAAAALAVAESGR